MSLIAASVYSTEHCDATLDLSVAVAFVQYGSVDQMTSTSISHLREAIVVHFRGWNLPDTWQHTISAVSAFKTIPRTEQ